MSYIYKTKKEKDAEAMGRLILIILVVAFLAIFVFIWIGYKILQFVYRNFLLEKIYGIMVKDWNVLYTKYNEIKKVGDYNEDIHEEFFEDDLPYYYNRVILKKISKFKMSIAGIGDDKIRVIFNKILKNKSSHYKRVAIIWILTFIVYTIALSILGMYIYKKYMIK